MSLRILSQCHKTKSQSKDAKVALLTRVVSNVRDSIRAETKIRITLFTPNGFFPSVSLHMHDKTTQLPQRKSAKAGHTP